MTRMIRIPTDNRAEQQAGFPPAVVLCVLCLLLISHSACNIFETRTPEDPEQVSSNYIPPTQPDHVFTNMTNAFRDLNSVNYSKSFADSSTSGRTFRYEATPQARSRYAGVFAHWTRQSEQQYFENIRSRLSLGAIPTLNINITAQTLSSDTAFFEAAYQLNIPQQAVSPKEARGRAHFYLVVDRTGSWSIWRWIDIANAPTDMTWSDIKGEFGQ